MGLFFAIFSLPGSEEWPGSTSDADPPNRSRFDVVETSRGDQSQENAQWQASHTKEGPSNVRPREAVIVTQSQTAIDFPGPDQSAQIGSAPTRPTAEYLLQGATGILLGSIGSVRFLIERHVWYPKLTGVVFPSRQNPSSQEDHRSIRGFNSFFPHSPSAPNRPQKSRYPVRYLINPVVVLYRSNTSERSQQRKPRGKCFDRRLVFIEHEGAVRAECLLGKVGGISRAQFVGFAVKIHWPGNQLSFLRMLELCLGNDERVEKGQLSGSRGHVYLAKGWLLALNDKEKEIGEEEGRQGEREVVLAGR